MIYYVVNQPKKIETALLDKAVLFACDYLNIDVDFTLEFKPMQRYCFGLCDYDTDETVIYISKGISKQNMIRTMFHEMVHLKQYTDGRLVSGCPQRWLGIPINETYESLPWEVEAFDLEEKMMIDFYSESV